MEKTHSNLIFRRRGLLGILLFIPMLAAFVFSRAAWQPSVPVSWAFNAVGWVSFLLYATFRLWATLYIGGKKDEELATEGPYSVTRNPLYVGSFFLAASLSFFLKSLSLLLVTAVVSLIYSWRVVKTEEAFLEKKFGEKFKAYCRSTPRFLPSFHLHRTDDFLTVQFKALRHEARRLGASFLFIPLALFILLWLRQSPWLAHPLMLP